MQTPEQPQPPGTPESPDDVSPVISPVPGSPTVEEKRPPSRGRPWLPDLYLATLIIGVFALDQLTKGWVRNNLILGASRPRDGFLRITHTYNTGSAFGLFTDQAAVLMVASVAAIGFLVLFYRSNSLPGPWLRTSLGLILGGAAGNLVDRITLGHVTDFIDVGAWPVFNLADSSIVVGLAVMAWFLLLSPKGRKDAATVSDTGHPESPQLQEEADEG